MVVSKADLQERSRHAAQPTKKMSEDTTTDESDARELEQVSGVADVDVYDDDYDLFGDVELRLELEREREQSDDEEGEEEEHEQEAQHPNATPEALTDDQDRDEVAVPTEARAGSSLTGAKRKHDDTIELADNHVYNSLSPAQEELNELKEQDEHEIPSMPVPEADTTSASLHKPPSSIQPLHAVHPEDTPPPTPLRKTSNAPRSYKPIKKPHRNTPTHIAKSLSPHQTPTTAPSAEAKITKAQRDITSPANEAADLELWCICHAPDDGALMIACDGPACPIEWFHANCVGIERPPGVKWYCEVCAPGRVGRKGEGKGKGKGRERGRGRRRRGGGLGEMEMETEMGSTTWSL
ncbi:2-(3-amino-3-carboxypropyl)histidine synthase [Ascochyta rabiei]|uniref:Zinc ion binding n=1 Tax=Didymella rabiei TaxID=5454 RepID=A0A162W4K7_DIDRA|nr:2-(3-amino-3-carboxypropyl)histidine synthase [Ascochyta rabiei]KZM18791.1 zinc ion binding [Ascochyta rabiei]UPX16162.1 2-(3-amino-3-carboxypropyl)histidine synthase [Ascochyta rabiei]